MKTNVGLIDRVIRISLGLLLLGLYATSVIGAWGLVGVVPLATGLVRFCPLYRLLGIQTCSVPRSLP
jgi:hypothetical protein